MKALSIRQPWASLIASGRKTIELRSWRTNYRGRLLILAGASPWRGDHGFDLGPLGVVVATVELADCRPALVSDTERACLTPPAEHFAWVLRDAKSVKQVPAKGRLGLYAPDSTLLRAIGIQ